jgi:hypothetical protein
MEVCIVCRSRGGDFCLLHSCRLEEGFELMSYPPLLEGGWLRTAAQKHGCSCQVLRHTIEERRFATVNYDILVDAPVYIMHARARRWCMVAGPGPLGSWRYPVARSLVHAIVHIAVHTEGRVASPSPQALGGGLQALRRAGV